MTMLNRRRGPGVDATRTCGRWIGMLVVAAALAGCGGGEGAVGSGGTGAPAHYAVGTVSGLGSVIVEGVAYQDSTAPALREAAPGQDVPADVKLGYRVSVSFETPGVAEVVRVEAAIVGPVASVGAGRLVVLGQTVTINADPVAGPVTQFGGGYAGLGDIAAADNVEIHGVLAGAPGAYTLQATRIDRQAAPPGYLRITGLAGEVAADRSSLALGSLDVDLNGAVVLPANPSLATGRTVTVLAPAAGLTRPTPSSWRVKAAQLRVLDLPPTESIDLSGLVSGIDVAAKTFRLGGEPVRFGAATVTPAGASPADGAYVKVHGTVAADGALVASSIEVRVSIPGTEAELRGNVSAFDAVTRHFTVRGVDVDFSAASIQGCAPAGLQDGRYVEVEGALTGVGVRALTVHCEDEPSGGTVEREGIAGAVDVVARTFSLTPESGPAVAVSWSDGTYFEQVTPATLAGTKVQAQGSLVGGVLVARKISR